MKIEVVYFTVKARNEFNDETKSHQIDFKMIYQDDEELWGYSFNPTLGWVLYTGFMQGWSEMDEDLNECLRAIREYVTTIEFSELLGTLSKNDKVIQEYYCKYNVHKPRTYKFDITVTEIETNEDGEI